MTTRELYNATIETLNEYGTDNAVDLMNEFKAALEKMDNQASARRVKAAEKAAARQAEKAPIREALFAVLDGENAKTATELIAAANIDIKPASVPSLLRPFVEEGAVLKVDVKVPGKGTQRGYVKA